MTRKSGLGHFRQQPITRDQAKITLVAIIILVVISAVVCHGLN
jgi:hypothetical protein